MKNRLRVALIGTSQRSRYLYGPIIKGLSSELELVAVWGRSEKSAARLATKLGVESYTDMDLLHTEQQPDMAIVCVAYEANGEVGKMAAAYPMHLLLETPIAHDLDDALAIMDTCKRMGTKIEVAEQFHRRPLEQIKRKLIESGVFGEVYTSFNDFGGHGYHGVSIMRSYLGFDAVPLSVSGAVASYELAPHVSRLEGYSKARTETQEHGIIRFKADKLGIFHWTDAGYDSALRWWRSSRFLAEKGMGITTGTGPVHNEQLTLLDPSGDSPMQIRIERRYERVDGGALKAMNAYTGLTDLPLISWENPLCTKEPGWNPNWGDDEISVALCVKSLVEAIRKDEAPSYGAAQACLDQEIILAIRKSASLGGLPVDLPLIQF